MRVREGKGGIDTGWETERGTKTRPVQFVSLKVGSSEAFLPLP